MYKRSVFLAAAALCVSVSSLPDSGNVSIWKNTPMESMVREFRSNCSEQDDKVACVKVKVLNLVEDVLRKDTFEISDTVTVIPNDSEPKTDSSRNGKSMAGFLEQLDDFVQRHDLLVKAPFGSHVRLSPKMLDQDQIAITLQLPNQAHQDDNQVSSRGRKNRLKKVMIPILVFVLLKAMTLIPLAIGVLSLKAWNALQLAFISFLVSISLAIFQLCKKVATEPHHGGAPIAYDAYPGHYAAAAARNFLIDPTPALAPSVVPQAHNLAYGGYSNAENSA